MGFCEESTLMHIKVHSVSIGTNYKLRRGLSKRTYKLTAQQFFLLTLYLDEILQQQVRTGLF